MASHNSQLYIYIYVYTLVIGIIYTRGVCIRINEHKQISPMLRYCVRVIRCANYHCRHAVKIDDRAT